MRVSVICARNIGVAFLKALMSRGFTLTSVFSPDANVHAFLKQNGIAGYVDRELYFNQLKSTEIDFLFSIINPLILPMWVLSIPRVAALNYHDSLLPKHRGVNAVAWAVWDGDLEIGYTWHEMTARVDSGRILFQSQFALNGSESTYQANLKVFAKTIAEFDPFLDRCEKLAKGEAQFTSHSHVKGELHRKSHRPSLEERTLLPGLHTSIDILRRARALNFGPLFPEFGTLRVQLPDESLLEMHPRGEEMCLVCRDGEIVRLKLRFLNSQSLSG